MSFVIRNRDKRYWIFADNFQLILSDTDIFSFVWKHQVFKQNILNFFLMFLTRTYLLELNKQ